MGVNLTRGKGIECTDGRKSGPEEWVMSLIDKEVTGRRQKASRPCEWETSAVLADCKLLLGRKQACLSLHCTREPLYIAGSQ